MIKITINIYHLFLDYYLKGLSAMFPKFILGLIPIETNYCINNLQAYGIFTLWTVALLQLEHFLLYWKKPHYEHIITVESSLEYKSLYNKRSLAPNPNKQSRYISPKRRPPYLLRPYVGCLVKTVTLPVDRAWILSATICFNLW